MKRIVVALVAAVFMASVHAQPATPSAKQELKDSVHTVTAKVKSGARSVKHGVKRAANSVKRAAKRTKRKVKRAFT